MAKKKAQQQVVIEGTPQDCFDALTEYETFPEWQSAVKSSEVVTRDGDGRGKEVVFEIDAKVKSISYRLSYTYEEPHLITWDYLDGDVKAIDGEYVFEDQTDGTTLATCTLHIDPGVWVPGPVAKVLNEQVMEGSMDDLKRRVEAG